LVYTLIERIIYNITQLWYCCNPKELIGEINITMFNETGKHEKTDSEWEGVWVRNLETMKISIIQEDSDEVLGELADDDALVLNTDWRSPVLADILEKAGYELIPHTLKRFDVEIGYYIA
jgi:hypothetical protein